MKKQSALEKEIERMETLMSTLDPDSKEYYRMIAQIERISDIERQNKKRFDVSGDTIVLAGVNLAGILLILQHERLHAVSTKALGFISKLKL